MRLRTLALALAAAAAVLLLAPTAAEGRRLAGGGATVAANAANASAKAAPTPTTPTSSPSEGAEQNDPQQQGALGFPRTRNVYVEVRVAHTPSYMALEGRADKLARLMRESAAVKSGQRMAVAAVDGHEPSSPSSDEGGGSSSDGGRGPSVTYGAVVFNDEEGAAEREVAAVEAPGALERVAAGARAFGVAVTDIAARFGTRRRMMMSSR